MTLDSYREGGGTFSKRSKVTADKRSEEGLKPTTQSGRPKERLLLRSMRTGYGEGVKRRCWLRKMRGKATSRVGDFQGRPER